MRISDWSSDVCSSDLVNFFGVVELLEGLRSALAASSAPRAAVVASSVAVHASDAELDQACANLDEASARARVEVLSEQGHGHAVYPGSKAALAKWVRRSATPPQWAGDRIPLNAVAPGVALRPMFAGPFEDPRMVAVTGPAVHMTPTH